MDPIYDHSVEDAFNTTNYGRQLNTEEDTYDHILGKQNECDYDLAG